MTIKGIALVLGIAFIVFVGAFIHAADGLPLVVIGTSTVSDIENKFFLNDSKAGDSRGFCAVYRSKKGPWSIQLKNGDETQTITIREVWGRTRISSPAGNDLGLLIVTDADQKMRLAYNCEM